MKINVPKDFFPLTDQVKELIQLNKLLTKHDGKGLVMSKPFRMLSERQASNYAWFCKFEMSFYEAAVKEKRKDIKIVWSQE